jgi:ubiquinone/menaquinone biosynthesis C-methylase UbiE
MPAAARKEPPRLVQAKDEEIAFFDRHAEASEYDVFTPETSRRLVRECVALAGLDRGARVVDLGCGSGVFTALLEAEGFRCSGLDLSRRLLRTGKRANPRARFIAGDVEQLPFASESLDGVLLSGILHHLPDRSRCAREVFRVLRPGGAFVGFDPNRLNPFMWLYRDRSSPFYSSAGVTPNERPILAAEVAGTFRDAGFRVKTSFLSGLSYRFIASSRLRWALPLYNFLDRVVFGPPPLARFRAFVLTAGVKA